MQLKVLAIVLLVALAAAKADAKDLILSTNIERTEVSLFVPEQMKFIRGVLINPADKNVGTGTVWSESCRHWQFAHMGIMMENVDKRNNRPRTIKKVIGLALAEFAEKSKHPELSAAPFVFGGMSKGGGWSAEIGQDFASRTIAFNNVCGWVGKPDKDLSMPAVIIIGGVPDAFKMPDAIATQYEPARKGGANWCLALQWGNAHNYGNANALAFPFLDAAIAERLPAAGDPPTGPVKLRELKHDSGWLGDRTTWETNYAHIASYSDFKGDRDTASWLPNRYVACAWRSFVSKEPLVQLDAETSDRKQKAARFKPTEKRFVILPAGAVLNLSADLSAKISLAKVTFYDGDNRLGESQQAPFSFAWHKIPEGPRAVFVEYTTTDGKVGVSNPVLVITGTNKQ